MKSIRVFLVVVILAVITLFNFVAALNSVIGNSKQNFRITHGR